MTLGIFFFLLAAYIVFHKVFPFALLEYRLIDLTVRDSARDPSNARQHPRQCVFGRKIVPTSGFEGQGQSWCERWIAIAFGTITIVVGSIVIALLQRKGFDTAMARWLARGILWVLF